MAIRFNCPSCQQPIEVDDEWAGHSVGCPYCKKVVSAPRSTTWPQGDIPQASPADPALQPPPPPPGSGYPTTAQHMPTSNAAVWALILAITSAVLSILGWFIWWIMITNKAIEKVGMDASQEELSRAVQEILLSGSVPISPFASAAAILGALCGITGIILAVRSLLQQQARKGMAITACILGVLFTCCQSSLIMTKLNPDWRVTTQPATTQPASPDTEIQSTQSPTQQI